MEKTNHFLHLAHLMLDFVNAAGELYTVQDTLLATLDLCQNHNRRI